MKMQWVWISVSVVGMSLVLLSWFWPSMSDGRRYWSDAQAKEYADTLATMHRLNSEVVQAQQMAQQEGGKNSSPTAAANLRLAQATETGAPIDPAAATPDRLNTELLDIQKRYAHQRADLEAARAHGQSTAVVMRWVGVILVVVGLGVMLASRAQVS